MGYLADEQPYGYVLEMGFNLGYRPCGKPTMVQFQKSRDKGLHKSEQGRYHFGEKTKDSENRRKPL